MTLPNYPQSGSDNQSKPAAHTADSLPVAPPVRQAETNGNAEETGNNTTSLRARFGRKPAFLEAGILNPEHPANKWIMLAVLAGGLAIVILDSTIVSIALPTIIQSLHLTITQAQWVTALYSIIFAAILLSTGSLADRFGRRRTFVVGIIIFLIGSILAGSSLTSDALILSRAIQGLGGAFVLPSTLSSVHTHFTGRNRAIAFGIWGTVMSATAAVGPLLGGTILKYGSWQYIFLINVPICIILLLGAALFVPNSKAEPNPFNPQGFDILGFILSALGAGSLVYGIIEGPRLGWWTPNTSLELGHNPLPTLGNLSPVPFIILCSVLFIGGFLLWEHFRGKAHKHVILNLRLFRIPTFSWGNLIAGTIAIGQFCLVFLLPLYLLNCLQVSFMTAGLVLASLALGALVAGGFARTAADLVTPAGVVIIGVGMEVVAVAVIAATIHAESSLGILVTLLVLYGIGLGFASAQLTSTVLRDVPVDVSGMGSSTQSTVRQLGTATGFALAGTVLTMSLSRRIPAMLENFGAPQTMVDKLTNQTIASAGSNLQNLHMPPFSDFLTLGFADAIADSMWVTVAFLCVGFLGAIQVWRVSRKSMSAADLHALKH